ncbi:hypothetical protein CGRA01v4_00908 [Colletotrichum graminicola]|nr:hypothetical protein CGRA01v4_00908 [Colletotrichum graminicola]
MRTEHCRYITLHMSPTPRHAMPYHASPPSCPGSSLASPIMASLPDAVRGFGTLLDSLSGTARLVDAPSRRFHHPPPPSPSRYRALGGLACHRGTTLCKALRGSTAHVHRIWTETGSGDSGSKRASKQKDEHGGTEACRVRNDTCKSHACHAMPRHGAGQIHTCVYACKLPSAPADTR